MPNENVLTAAELLEHWQGHRRVTRRMLEAFPEDQLSTFTLGGMRTFADFINELLVMAVPIATGVATGKWPKWETPSETRSKAELLALWDESTAQLNAVWPTIPPHRFAEVDKAFGQWEGTGIWIILYAIDNEVHHRGQGYVYLRALGIEPPAFYVRD